MFTFPFSFALADVFSNTLSTDFDGSNDDATVTPNAALSSDITNKLSVAVWVKGAVKASSGIISHYLNSGGNRKWMILQSSGGDRFRVILSDLGNNAPKDFTSADVVFDDTNWHLISFSYDGAAATTSQLKLYIDGVLDSSTKSADAACTSLFNSTTDVRVGEQGTVHYDGRLDEITVWDIPFSATDWTNLYNSGTPDDPKSHAQSANLVAYWRMGDGDTHPTITDNEGSNNLTMNDMAAEDFVSDVP